MSNNEPLQPAVNQESLAFELMKSDQNDNTKNAPAENAALPAVEEPNADKRCTESTAPSNTNDQAIEVATKEAEISNENSKAVPETANESTGETAEKVLTSEISQIQQLPTVPEVQQQTIGAGDTCALPQRDENANTQKTQEEIVVATVNNQTSQSDEKSPTGDKKENEDELAVSKLKEEFQKASEERDSYQKKLKGTEKKLALLQASYDALMKGEGDEVMLRRMVDQLKNKLIQTSLQLEDRIRVVANQEKQISALNSQVASLKEVESLTRSLLQIRNMEVKHLQAEVDDMEVRINEERDRYNTMINKMDAAVKLNADLKTEYETQLGLFRDLREKYEEKVTLLSEEKRALENNAQSVPK
ncbi:tropomyosin isoform X2 [Osmia bicornis bicornis]|nr:tropomyosin isoform X2 [Osmia bicornis bicornis]XP_029049694.2 tropomyosin isoform X2 [Osmia bicornis bicornis]XP_029049704.2 tropomyosin isoform X2 [Osmia bicornis bicornis]